MEGRANPARGTRGKRVLELEGSDAEDDQEFWNHDTWEESSEDEVYSTEEEKVDVFDSDFNETEDDDSDDDGEESSVRRYSFFGCPLELLWCLGQS
jgi:hypothetical protein